MMRRPSPRPIAASGGEQKWSASSRRFPGSLVSWSSSGGIQSTTPMPTLHTRLRRTAGSSSDVLRRSPTSVATGARIVIPAPSGRYGTWV